MVCTSLNLFILIFSALLLLNSIYNFFYLRPAKPGLVDSKIAILIPARNEEENIKNLLSDLSEQSLLSDYTVTVLDDNSTDLTADAVQAYVNQYENVEIMEGKALPSEWLGKNYACHQLAVAKSDAKFLLFLDADVRVSKDAIATAISELQSKNLNFISPYPKQIAKSWSEYLIQPLLQWSWLSTLPIKLAQRSSRPSLTAANGQFFVVQTAAYIASGGHKAIKGEVIDDMELAKSLKRAGFKGGVSNGSKIASCRMYQNWPQLRNGYQKSLWRAFNSIPNAIGVSMLLILFFVYPFYEMLKGSLIGLLSYLLIVLSRMVAAKLSRGNLLASFLHPISILLFIYLLITSWIQHLRGNLSWKGRKL